MDDLKMFLFAALLCASFWGAVLICIFVFVKKLDKQRREQQLQQQQEILIKTARFANNPRINQIPDSFNLLLFKEIAWYKHKMESGGMEKEKDAMVRGYLYITEEQIYAKFDYGYGTRTSSATFFDAWHENLKPMSGKTDLIAVADAVVPKIEQLIEQTIRNDAFYRKNISMQITRAEDVALNKIQYSVLFILKINNPKYIPPQDWV